jgi:hypothetical protein
LLLFLFISNLTMRKFALLFSIILISINFLQAQWQAVKDYDSIALPPTYQINSVAADTLGNAYVSGIFTNTYIGARDAVIYRFNGSVWVSMPTPDTAYSVMLACDRMGHLYGSGGRYVSKWNGTGWMTIGDTVPPYDIAALTADNNGNLYATRYMLGSNSFSKEFVEKWNGTSWSLLDSTSPLISNNSNLYSVVTDAAGNLYAAGSLKDASDSGYVIKWDGTSWSKLGTGSTALKANNNILSLAVDAAGNVYASGLFTDANRHGYVAKCSLYVSV